MNILSFLKTVLLNLIQIQYSVHIGKHNELSPEWFKHHLGTRSNYPTERFHSGIDNITFDYNVEQVQLLIRHGTRYPVTSGIEAVSNALEKLSQSNNTELTGWIRTYKNPYIMSRQGQLEAQGQIEMFEMGRRFASRYPEFVNTVIDHGLITDWLRLSSSWSNRALQSGQAFSLGAFQGLGPLDSSQYMTVPIYSVEKSSDKLIAYLKACPRWVKEAKVQAKARLLPIYAKYMTPIAARLSGLLGVDINTDDVAAIYNACTSEVSLYKRTDTFCQLFSKEDVLILEYMDDLKHYYLYSYGLYEINGKVSCALGKHIFGNIQSMVRKEKDSIKLDIKFGHTQTLQPLRTLLGLYKEELSINSTIKDVKNRVYRMSTFGYFANNFMIQLLSHKQTKEYYVRLLDNETPVQLSECKTTICTLQEFYSFILPKVDCDFENYCKI